MKTFSIILIGYLTRFEDAIHYGKFKQQGWRTGSGKIESAHRHVVQERLKIPGACWRIESIDPMMALRNTNRMNGGQIFVRCMDKYDPAVMDHYGHFACY